MNTQYDCIIVGAGIAGLLAGNMLIDSNKKVLILENNSFPGGYFSKIEVEGNLMDSSVSYYLGMEERSPLMKFLNGLNLCPKLQFKKVEFADLYIFPDSEFILECDAEAFRKRLKTEFPSETLSIDAFFESMRHVYYTFTKLGSIKTLGENELVRKHIGSTYAQFLDELFDDKILKGILSARVFGSRASMLTMLAYLGKIVYEGLFQESTGNDIVDALHRNLINNNIEVSLNTKVNTIGIKDKRAEFVLTQQKKLDANLVVSAIDMTKLLCHMVKPAVPVKVQNQVKEKTKSLSSITLYLIVKNLPRRILTKKVSRVYLFDDYDVVSLYERKERGAYDLSNGLKINIEHVTDVDFETKKSYNLRVECDIKYSAIPGNTNRKRIQESILSILESKLEIKSSDILCTLLQLPSDLELLSGCSEGSGSGWSPDTDFWDSGRFMKQIAANLVQIGCWDKFGSGIFPIFLSAKQLVSRIELKNN